MPLIAGPGAITSVMILASDASTWKLKLVLFGVIALVLILTYLIFRAQITLPSGSVPRDYVLFSA